MDVGAFITGFQTIDLVLVLAWMGFFVLGFAQGTIRRLIGVGSILFSFFLAANIAEPLGSFLGGNWTQFPPAYSYMIGFLTVFVAAAVAFALIAQGFYHPQPLFEKARFVDEVIGGLLGMLEAVLLFIIVIIILDSFFVIPGIPESGNELHFLRDFWVWMDAAQVTAFFRESILPIFFTLFGLFVPDDIEQIVTGP